MHCKRHPRYLGVRKHRADRCWRCYWLYVLKILHPSLRVGRPVIHRRADPPQQ